MSNTNRCETCLEPLLSHCCNAVYLTYEAFTVKADLSYDVYCIQSEVLPTRPLYRP